MAKTTGPLMSLAASGSVAGTIVFSSWKGRSYVRQLVRPSNPQTGPQMGNRAMMRFLSRTWAYNVLNTVAYWATVAARTSISPFNAFVAASQSAFARGGMPTQDPTATTTPYSDTPSFTVTPGIKSATLVITPGTQTGVYWGTLVYRSQTTGFSPANSNLVDVLDVGANPPADTTWLDTPLSPGTYYYVTQGFGSDGTLGTPTAQQTAVVT